MRRRWILSMALAAIATAGSALAAPAPAPSLKVVSQGPAVQAAADGFVLHSARTGRDYLVEVTAPPVGAALPGQKFPAIVSLDGGYGVAGPEGRMLVGMAAMEAAFMVAVGYPPDQPNARAIDLTHQPYDDNGALTGGGGAAFQAFLVEELKPFLEARYPIDGRRLVLFGHSLGGLFAANVLASQPDAFAAYLIGSPSVQRDEGVVAKVAAAAPKGGGRRVFVAVGGKEPDYMLKGADRIAAALSGLGSGFRVERRVYADDTHLSYYPAMVLAGFPQVLPRTAPPPDQTGAVRLDAAVLSRYVGAYRLADGRTVSVSLKGDKLMGQLTGLPLVELTAQSDTRFFVRGVDAQVTFEASGAGLLLKLNGAEARAARAN